MSPFSDKGKMDGKPANILASWKVKILVLPPTQKAGRPITPDQIEVARSKYLGFRILTTSPTARLALVAGSPHRDYLMLSQ